MEIENNLKLIIDKTIMSFKKSVNRKGGSIDCPLRLNAFFDDFVVDDISKYESKQVKMFLFSESWILNRFCELSRVGDVEFVVEESLKFSFALSGLAFVSSVAVQWAEDPKRLKRMGKIVVEYETPIMVVDMSFDKSRSKFCIIDYNINTHIGRPKITLTDEKLRFFVDFSNLEKKIQELEAIVLKSYKHKVVRYKIDPDVCNNYVRGAASSKIGIYKLLNILVLEY